MRQIYIREKKKEKECRINEMLDLISIIFVIFVTIYFFLANFLKRCGGRTTEFEGKKVKYIICFRL